VHDSHVQRSADRNRFERGRVSQRPCQKPESLRMDGCGCGERVRGMGTVMGVPSSSPWSWPAWSSPSSSAHTTHPRSDPTTEAHQKKEESGRGRRERCREGHEDTHRRRAHNTCRSLPSAPDNGEADIDRAAGGLLRWRAVRTVRDDARDEADGQQAEQQQQQQVLEFHPIQSEHAQTGQRMHIRV
jgi:hypothetical protein